MKDPSQELLKLLDSHGAGLHALLTRLTLRQDVAEDLMQELAVKLLRSEGFPRAEDPAAYAARAAVRLAFDWRRSRRRHPAPASLAAEPPDPANPSSLGGLIRAEQIEAILDAAGRLSDLPRQALVLRFVQDLPYEQVAARLGKSVHQARALCHKAVRRVRKLMQSQGPPQGQEAPAHEE